MTDRWGDILGRWSATPGAAALRAYSDDVNASLLARWLPAGRSGTVLKTDLFDEAVAPGLYPVLRARAETVIGLDVSPAVVAAALERYPELDGRVGDVRALPAEDASVDVVVSNSTLDHLASLDEMRAALAELRRVLVPGGRLIVTVDNRTNPLVALRNALPSRPLQRSGLIPYAMGVAIGPRRLRLLLTATGLEVLDTAAVMHVPRVLVRALSRATAPERLLRRLRRAEALAALPTAPLTGQFVAALGRR